VSRIVAATADRLGRPSRWDGQLFEELHPGLAGTGEIHPGHTMTLSRAHVFDRARPLIEGRPPTADELVRVRGAVILVVHEAMHLDSRFDAELEDFDASPATSVLSLELEESLADVLAHGLGDDVVNRSGFDRTVPELIGVRNFYAYPVRSKTLIGLTGELSGWSGRKVADVLFRLKAADMSLRWATAADLVIDKQFGTVDAHERSELRPELHGPLRRAFVRAHKIALDESLPAAVRFEQVAESVKTAADEVNEVIARHTNSAAVEPIVRDASVGSLRRILDAQPAPGVAAAASAPAPGMRPADSARPQPTQTID
jgi:hypothetical protein